MPWLTVNYKDEQLRSDLKQRYGINAIPTIVIIDQKGTMITDEGRFELQSNHETAVDIWKKKAEEIYNA